MTDSPAPPNYLELFRTASEQANELTRMVDEIFAKTPTETTSLGLFGLGAPPASGGILQLSYPPQPPFEDWRREAAWKKTAGHVDAPCTYDEYGVWLDRNAKPGERGCWHAAHIVDDALHGPDVPSNYRALNSYRNLSDGGVLGALLKRR